MRGAASGQTKEGWLLSDACICDAQPETVSCTQWKRELSLNKKGKEGSRELALRLFPTAADMLKCAPSS